MTKQRNAFKAGLFILISIGLMIALSSALRGSIPLPSRCKRRTVTFRLTDNLSGLDKGDDVRVGGVKVGKVTHIEYVESAADGKPLLIVHFHIPKKYNLREGAEIAIESTVTGSADLNLTNLGSGNELPPERALVGLSGGVGRCSPRPTARSTRSRTLPTSPVA